MWNKRGTGVHEEILGCFYLRHEKIIKKLKKDDEKC